MEPSEQLFRAMVENSPEAIFVGAAERFAYVNPAALRLFGATSAAQLLDQPVMERIHPDSRAAVLARIHRLYEHKVSVPPLEEQYLRLDGTPVDVEVSAVPFRYGDEDGALVFVRDIGLRKRTEAVMRTQAERHANLLATTGDGFWICDLKGRVLEVNEAFSRMSGYTREELLSLRIPDIEAVESPEDTARHIQQIMATGYDRFETRHRRKDGTEYEVEIMASYWANQMKILVFHRDISQRKAAEAELRRNQELLRSITVSRALTDAMGIGVIGMDATHRVVFANPRAQQLLNITEAGMLGQPLDKVVRAVTEAGSSLTDETCPAWARIAAGQIFQTEAWTFARQDGDRFPVSLVLAPIADPAVPAGSVLSFHDITTRKAAEQALLDADRRKDEFLAMLAHELRNPLAPIRNAAYILGRLGLDEPRLQWAQEVIEGQVRHLSRLVDELLDVSRIVRGKVTLQKERIELTALIDQVAAATRPLFAAKAQRFTVGLPERPAWLNGDAVRLTQVLSNLLDNAIKYTPEGGTIQLDARLAGQDVEIRVRDNGQGIPAELLPRVFDLFQQGERPLDRAQGGLGIGLTLVRQLVVMHDGRVEAHSAGPGQGAELSVRLPMAAAAPAPAREARAATPAPAQGRILVVDDDPHVASSTAALLEQAGYQVAIADSGHAALERFPSFRPGVVLLDIGLKGLDGFETAQRLRQLPQGREPRLVAVTGYADDTTRDRALAAGCDHHLAKPVCPEALLALLAKEQT